MIFIAIYTPFVFAHNPIDDPFRELEELLPTPNKIRTASGRPGSEYWQQQADYQMEITLDDNEQMIYGVETITYTNNSPDELPYLWVQLDQNIFSQSSDRQKMRGTPHMSSLSTAKYLDYRADYNGEVNIEYIKDAQGKEIDFRIQKTMMRINIPEPLNSGDSLSFSISWNYEISDAKNMWMRTGYEYFEEEDNYIYEMAMFFPRMASYTDVHGWHHKQYLGSGEFTLDFGNYDVKITVPKDHIVTATGELLNAEDVLKSKELKRWEEAKTSDKPIFIRTPKEAENIQKNKSKETQTWHYRADNVRDFAFASSRKFIWDAWGREINGKLVMAQSLYPNEAEPLWSTYSTHAVAHTLDIYSKMVYPYPYPSAISVNGAIGGMEYPMICFNGPRPVDDGTYFGKAGNGNPWRHSKYALISVIIHEVGHNWFPMIINSDERAWTWMDEGLNSFVQFHAEQTWEDEYPSRRGEADSVNSYMQRSNTVPIMTDADSLIEKGNNAYGKPATALSILRNTVLSPEVFDEAMLEYGQTWAFKRPMPADFFRLMEESAGEDLDWFWQGWFYTTEYVDLEIGDITQWVPNTNDPHVDSILKKQDRDRNPISKARQEYVDGKKYVDRFPDLIDFYNTYDPLDVTDGQIEEAEDYFEDLTEKERKIFDRHQDKIYTHVEIKNNGQLVTPVVLEIETLDGNIEELRYPADIWRRNQKNTRKMLITNKPVVRITIDPHHELADVDHSNNQFPREIPIKRYDLTPKSKTKKNPMQKKKEQQEDDDE